MAMMMMDYTIPSNLINLMIVCSVYVVLVSRVHLYLFFFSDKLYQQSAACICNKLY